MIFQSAESKLCSAVVQAANAKIKALLEKDADPNEIALEGSSAFHLAVESGNQSIVKLLLDSGAKPEHKNSRGETALIIAARKGHSKLFKELLDHGAKINAVDPSGNTALMHITIWASRMSSLGLPATDQKLKGLINAGADPNIVDKAGRTPMMAAVRSGGGALEEDKRLPVLMTLLDAGADINVQSKKGRSTLMSAAFRGLKDTVQFLLHSGANPDLVDNHGMNALMYAARGCFWSYRKSGYINVVRMLLDRTTDLGHRDNRDRTALRIAESEGPDDIVKLINKGPTDFDSDSD